MGSRVGDFSLEVKSHAHERAGFMCEMCGENPSESVHHLLPVAVAARHYPSLSIQLLSSLENATALCENCHTLADQESWRNHEYYAARFLSQQLAINADRELNERAMQRKMSRARKLAEQSQRFR